MSNGAGFNLSLYQREIERDFPFCPVFVSLRGRRGNLEATKGGRSIIVSISFCSGCTPIGQSYPIPAFSPAIFRV